MNQPQYKWDRYGLTTARQQADWSKDPSTKVGAVILRRDGTVAATGWNGFPRGIADDDRLLDRTTKLELILHAEENAILAAREPLRGMTLYVWPFHPCTHCAAHIIQAGITRVVSPAGRFPGRWYDSFLRATKVLAEGGVWTSFLDPETFEATSIDFLLEPAEADYSAGSSSTPEGKA